MTETRAPYKTNHPDRMTPRRALALALLVLDERIEAEQAGQNQNGAPRYTEVGRELVEARRIVAEIKAGFERSLKPKI